MSNERPLRNIVDELAAYTRANEDRLKVQTKLLEVMEGDLLPYLREALQKDLSPKSYKNVLTRIVPINLIPRLIDKLSQLYSQPITRKWEADSDRDIIEEFIKNNDINTSFGMGNALFNLHKYVSTEPYFYKKNVNDRYGVMKNRLIDATQFLAYSDDFITKEMTVFLKWMGVDEHKNNIWYAYDEEEFMPFNSNGDILENHYPADNLEGINPYGVIPIVFTNVFSTKLMAKPDESLYEMNMKVPILYSDLNLVHKYQAHSSIIAKNMKPSDEISSEPGAVTYVYTIPGKDGEPSQGSFDILKPELEIDASISLLSSQIGLWLESRNIKAGTIGKADASISGISKILDQADTSSARQKQVSVFSTMERDYWRLFSIIYNQHVNELEGNGVKLSESPLTSIKFAEQKPLEDDLTRSKKIKQKIENRTISHIEAIRQDNPHLDEDEVQVLFLEIEEERAKALAVDDLFPTEVVLEDDGE